MSDFRLHVGFFTHHKTVKLTRRLGVAGAWSFLHLLAFVAQNRPKGQLDGMDAEDIEIAAGWSGEPGRLVAELQAIGFLDDATGVLSIHDWEKHNPYAAHREERSLLAKRSVMVRWVINEIKRQGREKEVSDFKEWLSNREYSGESWEQILTEYNQNTGRIRSNSNGNTPPPSPLPLPYPSPKEEKDPSSPVGEERSYSTKSGKKLKGKQLEMFEAFWKAFDYKKGRAEAADAWLAIKVTPDLLGSILGAAMREAKDRPALVAAGRTPKMAQGWLSARRWEDEQGQVIQFAREPLRVQEADY
jgi:hypothetical protein